MKYYVEKSLSDFEFWSGAKANAEELTTEELDALESVLEEAYPDGITETQINDIMWLEFDWVCEMVGIAKPQKKTMKMKNKKS